MTGRSAADSVHEIPHRIWITSGVFALLVGAAYKYLEEPTFVPIVCGLALVHVSAVGAWTWGLSRQLFLSQTFVVLTTVASVSIHVTYLVGPPSAGVGSMLGRIIWDDLRAVGFYTRFGLHALAFAGLVATIVLVLRASRIVRVLSVERILAVTYAGSAVWIAVHYALTRPFYHVFGDPDDKVFFFIAGILGIEFALILHCLLLIACVWRYWVVRTRFASDAG